MFRQCHITKFSQVHWIVRFGAFSSQFFPNLPYKRVKFSVLMRLTQNLTPVCRFISVPPLAKLLNLPHALARSNLSLTAGLGSSSSCPHPRGLRTANMVSSCCSHPCGTLFYHVPVLVLEDKSNSCVLMRTACEDFIDLVIFSLLGNQMVPNPHFIYS